MLRIASGGTLAARGQQAARKRGAQASVASVPLSLILARYGAAPTSSTASISFQPV